MDSRALLQDSVAIAYIYTNQK